MQFLDEVRRSGGKASVSDLVVAETYFALQFHYGISKHDALAALTAIFSMGEVSPVDTAGLVMKEPRAT
ncbi:MAG: hypothetical protein JSS02_15330 [Planctomycetes bacterium]|nr:hypothetical protein [Planctomycetota bacterium]